MTSQVLLDAASQLVEKTVGLRLDPAQRHRLDYWLKSVAAERGVEDSKIVEEIAAEGPALQMVLDELTVQETSFFRDRAQFEALRAAVLPTLPPPLTIWSAGCAWGHEPYSLAMVLDAIQYPEWQVVASDISSRALKQAQSGRYPERLLTGLTEEERGRYLHRAGDEWEVIPRLRQRVTVFRHNLVRESVPRQAKGSAVVFCRNVLIYFERPEVLGALATIAATMNPEGWMFLGYSESLWQVTEAFRLVRVGKAFAYRRADLLPPSQPFASLVPQEAPSSRRCAPPAEGQVPLATRLLSGERPAPVSLSAGQTRAPSPRAADMLGAHPSYPTSGVDGNGGVPSVAALLAEGEAALQAGDPAAAVQALRKAAYLDPDNGIAQFQLGLAFEQLGETGQARRAFGAARAALGRSSAAAEVALEGYQIGELIRLLDHRLAPGPAAVPASEAGGRTAGQGDPRLRSAEAAGGAAAERRSHTRTRRP
ncbi:MAG TPA: CheR family methyltransferase [Candidatus Binatia bacterium]|nr:CheR family methyltransferase [Candidatus Binatia bacterium]